MDPTLRLPNGVAVPPNGTYTFIFEMKAPGSPGTYLAAYQMKQAGGAVFGQSAEQSVIVE